MLDRDTGCAAHAAASPCGGTIERTGARIPMDLAAASGPGARHLLAGTAMPPRGCFGGHGRRGHPRRNSAEDCRAAGHRPRIFGAALVARHRRPERQRLLREYAPELALRIELLD